MAKTTNKKRRRRKPTAQPVKKGHLKVSFFDRLWGRVKPDPNIYYRTYKKKKA